MSGFIQFVRKRDRKSKIRKNRASICLFIPKMPTESVTRPGMKSGGRDSIQVCHLGAGILWLDPSLLFALWSAGNWQGSKVRRWKWHLNAATSGRTLASSLLGWCTHPRNTILYRVRNTFKPPVVHDMHVNEQRKFQN